MSRTLDDLTAADNPAAIPLSWPRLLRLEPGLKVSAWRRRIGRIPADHQFWADRLPEHLALGDAGAAMVICLRPMLVAVHSAELGAAVVLGFPDWLIKEHGLVYGSRLVGVNLYDDEGEPARDLGAAGEVGSARWLNIFPLVADFLTDDAAALRERAESIPERDWYRVETAGRDYLRRTGGRFRDGTPTRAMASAI